MTWNLYQASATLNLYQKKTQLRQKYSTRQPECSLPESFCFWNFYLSLFQLGIFSEFPFSKIPNVFTTETAFQLEAKN